MEKERRTESLLVGAGLFTVLYSGGSLLAYLWLRQLNSGALRVQDGQILFISALVLASFWLVVGLILVVRKKAAPVIRKQIFVTLGIALVLFLLTSVPLADSAASGYTEIHFAGTGQSDPRSVSPQIYLKGLRINGREIDLTAFSSDGWDIEEKGYIDVNQQALVLGLPRYQQLEVDVMTSPISGELEIGLPGRTVLYDTYTAQYINNTLLVPYTPLPADLLFVAGCLGHLFLFIASLLSLLCLQFINKRTITQARVAAALLLVAAIFNAVCLDTYAKYPLPLALSMVTLLVFSAAALLSFCYHRGIFAGWRAKCRLALCLLAGLFAVSTLSSQLNIHVSSPISCSLAIHNTKNLSSDGTGIMLTNIYVNGLPISLGELQGPGWVLSDDGLYSDTVSNALMLNTSNVDSLCIEVLAGPGAGVLQISGSGINPTYIDCYRFASSIRNTDIKLSEKSPQPLLSFFARTSSFLATFLLCFFFVVPTLVQLLHLARLRTPSITTNPPLKKGTAFLYALVPLLVPLVFLGYLYAQNASYLRLSHVALTALIIAIVAAALYFGLLRLLRSPGASSLACTVFWLLFFTYSSIFSSISSIFTFLPENLFFLFFLLTMALLLTGAMVLGSRCPKPLFQALATFEMVILLFNLSSLLFGQFSSPQINPNNYKTTFVVDETSPSPNVYWFHTDGMISIENMEHYFGDDQAAFVTQLEDRGFRLNRDAYFYAAYNTEIAIPTLMSPTFYDSVLEPVFIEEMRTRDDPIITALEPAAATARRENELINAFEAKGYASNVITQLSVFFYPNTTRFYDTGTYTGTSFYEPASYRSPLIEHADDTSQNVVDSQYYLSNLGSLLTATSLLARNESEIRSLLSWLQPNELERSEIAPSREMGREIIGSDYPESGVTMIRALADVLTTSSPRLTVIHDFLPHAYYCFDEDGNWVGEVEGQMNVEGYPAQHRYSARVLMDMIDMVLEVDSGAVIVVQSDHGIHMGLNTSELLDLGYTEEDVWTLRNGTMSAVRIPEAVGGLDAPLDPLNITRELINRYIGRNYTLLPPDQKNQRNMWRSN